MPSSTQGQPTAKDTPLHTSNFSHFMWDLKNDVAAKTDFVFDFMSCSEMFVLFQKTTVMLQSGHVRIFYNILTTELINRVAEVIVCPYACLHACRCLAILTTFTYLRLKPLITQYTS